jgi:hypothetical protein
VANPNKADEQQNAESQQENSRNILGCPLGKRVAVLTSDFLVNFFISNIDRIVDDDDRYAHIANLPCDSAVDFMLGLGLVVSSKHFCHFKVPVSKQEVTNVPEYIT